MPRPRLLNTILGVVIAAGCGGEQTSPLEPETSLGLLSGLNTLLLSCTPLPATSSTVVIGVSGGTVSVGPHTLTVPAGALAGPVGITAEVVSDRVNSVRFTPEGLRFAAPARLSMSYANCYGLGMLLPKKIVYTDEGLNLLEILGSVDLFGQKRVTSSLKHFSRYAIAY